ncbi:MAG: AfsR/SARP family transcriptional regulator [Stenotrophomonas sp.]
MQASAIGDRNASTGKGLVKLMGQTGERMPVPVIYRKGWALLGYLALESGRMHSRAMLAALLWPGLAQSAGLTNLRQVLSNLNRFCIDALGDGVLRIERGSAGLMRGARPLFDIDLIVQSPCEGARFLFEQRCFLEGMEEVAGLDFQRWLQCARQSLEVQLLDATARCCDEMIAAQQWDHAIALSSALNRRDPWSVRYGLTEAGVATVPGSGCLHLWTVEGIRHLAGNRWPMSANPGLRGDIGSRIE